MNLFTRLVLQRARHLACVCVPVLAVLLAAMVLPTVTASAAIVTAPQIAPAPAGPQLPQCSVPGISTLCRLGGKVPLPPLPNPIGSVASGITDDVATGITNWVTSSARDVLNNIAVVIRENTAPDLSQQWFTDHYLLMIEIMAPVMLAMVVITATRSALMGDPAIAGRLIGYLPVAFIVTFAAVPLLDELLKVIDELSAPFAASVSTDFGAFAQNVGCTLSQGGTNCASTGNDTIVGGLFTLLIAGVAIVIGGLLVFLMLLVRQGLIYTIAIFIPISLAWALLGGVLERMTKFFTDVLVVAILSKFQIVVVLSLFAAGFHANSSHRGLTTLLLAIAALVVAVALPFKLLGALPGMRRTAGAMAARHRGGAALLAAPSSPGHVYAGVRNATAMRAGFDRTGLGTAALAGASAAAGGGGLGGVSTIPLLGAVGTSAGSVTGAGLRVALAKPAVAVATATAASPTGGSAPPADAPKPGSVPPAPHAMQVAPHAVPPAPHAVPPAPHGAPSALHAVTPAPQVRPSAPGTRPSAATRLTPGAVGDV